jgi:hypothetical protein
MADFTKAEATRLLTIVNHLYTFAEIASSYMPQGRGGKLADQREATLKGYRDEAHALLARYPKGEE